MSNSNTNSVDYPQFHTVVLRVVDMNNYELLHDWLRTNGLMAKKFHCKNCQAEMELINDPRLVDKHVWICPTNCTVPNVPVSIRRISFFDPMPKIIDLFDILKIVLLWCENRSLESIDFDSEKQRRAAKQVFQQCDRITETEMKKCEADYREKIGKVVDPSASGLVLLDTFPSGLMAGAEMTTETNSLTSTSSESEQSTSTKALPKKIFSTQGNNHFLCFADLKTMPPKVWVHLLRQGNKVPNIARMYIHPAAIVVTNQHVTTSRELQNVGRRAVDMETLQKYDTGMHRIVTDIEVIWGRLLPVLKRAEHLNMQQARLLLSRFLWHQEFGTTSAHALYHLMCQATQQYPLN